MMRAAVRRQARLTFDDWNERVVKADGRASTRRVTESNVRKCPHVSRAYYFGSASLKVLRQAATAGYLLTTPTGS